MSDPCFYSGCGKSQRIKVIIIQMEDAPHARKGDRRTVYVCRDHLSTVIRDAERVRARVAFSSIL
jgi:hypothetical protein